MSADGFLKTGFGSLDARPVMERVADHDDIYLPIEMQTATSQAARCMQCGTPFCENACPVGSDVSQWLELAERGHYRRAYELLEVEALFPEILGRICTAPCQFACSLSISHGAVNIPMIERFLGDLAVKSGWIVPHIPTKRTTKRIAIVGSGPSGLAAAKSLNRLGHEVVVFERDKYAGGMLRYIPEFRLPHEILDKRIEQLHAEGVRFNLNAHVGTTLSPAVLSNQFDAVILCVGCTTPRDLPLPGRMLKGIYFVHDLLKHYQRGIAERNDSFAKEFVAGKNVVVLADKTAGWVGALTRMKAASVLCINILERRPFYREENNPWPQVALVQDQSPFYEEEGVQRKWSQITKEFIGENGRLTGIRVCDVEWSVNTLGHRQFNEVVGTTRVLACELAVIAQGYVGADILGFQSYYPDLKRNERGNVVSDEGYLAGYEALFVAGDARTGQSIVASAINEGKNAAMSVHKWLCG